MVLDTIIRLVILHNIPYIRNTVKSEIEAKKYNNYL